MSERVAGRRKFLGAARGCRPLGMRLKFAESLGAENLGAESVRWHPRCRRIAPLRRRRPRSAFSPSRKVGFEAGEFRPGLLGLAATGALAVRGCLYEIVYEMRRVVPCFAGDICDFFPPFRGVLAAHYVLPPRVNCTSLYAQPRRHYVRAPIGRGAEGLPAEPSASS